jgi:ferric-dicitrate binding protein FerR (iron transport regulator)
MKPIDELLIAWRDETITADELKELERLLAEPDAREQLFDEFLTTAAITEALRVDSASPRVRQEPQSRTTKWRDPRVRLWSAAAVMLLSAGAIFLYLRSIPPLESQPPHEFQIVSGSALVDQKKDGFIAENSVIECVAGAPATIQFPDGSIMELASSSSTVMHRRGVELKAGKATFQIQKVNDASDAFSVKTAVGTVSVLGTKFSVELEPHGRNTNGGTDMKRAAMIMAVSVLAGSVSVNYNGSNYVLAMGQSQAFGEDKDAAPVLPPVLKGYSGGINGHVVSVNKDSMVIKLGRNSKQGFEAATDKVVVVIVKDVKDLPELKAGDQVYGKVTEVEGQLVATTLSKAASK